MQVRSFLLNARIVLGLSIWVLLAPVSAQTLPPFDQKPYVRAQTLVEIAPGRHLNMVCMGTGSPTVILEAGFGDTSVAWRYVQPEIAKITRVCAYDRAGLGFSDPDPTAQDLRTMSAALHQLVVAADIKRPFILVAHSMGGMIAVYYAERYPADLSGMVLVDPAVGGQEKLLATVTQAYFEANAAQEKLIKNCLSMVESGVAKATPKDLANCSNITVGAGPELRAAQEAWARNPSYWRALLSESEAMFSMDGPVTLDDRELKARKSGFGDLQLIILTAGNALPSIPAKERGPTNALWFKAHDELAARSSRGSNQVIPKSGHYIQYDDPAVVIEAITEVIVSQSAVPKR